MISNSCKNSAVVDSFVDIGADLVLSMWFVLAILYLTLETSGYNCEANDGMYNELFTLVKHWLTNRIHGKAAEHS